jgi:1,4-dihydroxy-2-naphthoyl-CoA hydrolase
VTTTPPGAGGAASRLPDQTTGIHGLLDVEVIEATPERVVLRLPVDSRVHQPYGILHGGVSALLAESAASFGGALNAEPGQGVVGIELNASHLRSLRTGHLTATATPIRVGRTIHVWRIDLTDDEGRDICAARCSLAVIDAPEGAVVAPGAPSAPE